MEDTQLDRAADNLWMNRRLTFNGQEMIVIHLVRSRDMRPLHVPWWKGKEVFLLGVESNGNLLLRHCDGSVRLWVHTEQSDHVLARSISEFLKMLKAETNG